jgi:hypothetical protein
MIRGAGERVTLSLSTTSNISPIGHATRSTGENRQLRIAYDERKQLGSTPDTSEKHLDVMITRRLVARSNYCAPSSGWSDSLSLRAQPCFRALKHRHLLSPRIPSMHRSPRNSEINQPATPNASLKSKKPRFRS